MFQDPRSPGGGGFFGMDPFNFGGSNGLLGGGGIDPMKLGLLSGFAALAQAGAPSTTPKSFAGALASGVQGGIQGLGMGQQFQAMGEQNALRRAQMAEMQRKGTAATEQDARVKAFIATLPESEQAMASANPNEYLQAYYKSHLGDKNKPMVVPAGASVFDPKTGLPMFRGETKEAGAQSDLGKLAVDLRSGLISQEEYDERKKRILSAPQPLVQINPLQDNLGLKPKDRFDMEGKLRDDFRGNPTVKAADEMDSAFKLIETAYQRPSPANDMAMATKYMKILDPGSVVRESELALAMSATGLLDKVQNYAQQVLNGAKLNPAQREDFYKSAGAINDAFQKERDNIAGRFSENASQYNLSPDNVVGKKRQRRSAGERTVTRRGSLNGRRVVEYSDGVVEYE